MTRQPPRCTRTVTPFPYTTLFRSLRSTVVVRHASITAVLATALLADAVLGGLLFAVLIGTGLPAGGSAALAAGIAGVGLLFAGMAAVSSQVTEGTRAASGIAGVALAVSFVLRAIGDVGDGQFGRASCRERVCQDV